MATIVNAKDVFLQAEPLRQIVVTVPSTNVTGQIDGTAASTVKTQASTAAAHAASTGNPHGVSLTQIAGDLDDIADGSSYFKSTANQNTGATRAFSALNSSSEYIKSLKSTQLTVVGSNPSTGWVGDVNGIRMYQSSVLKVNIPVSGDPFFDGDLDVSGQAEFHGSSTVSGFTAAVHANTSLSSLNGLQAFSGAGVGGRAVYGLSVNGYGVYGSGTTSGATGVQAVNSGGGDALSVSGRMTMTSTTLVSNLNADMVDGKHSSALCSIVPTNSGTCNVSGNGFSIAVTGTLASTVRTRGTSNIVFIENISDRRLKQDIEDETKGLDFINELRPRSFRMISNPDILAHGLIYQEVAELIGEKVDTLAGLNSDGTGSVDYNGIVSPIIKAIQEFYEEFQEFKRMKNG